MDAAMTQNSLECVLPFALKIYCTLGWCVCTVLTGRRADGAHCVCGVTSVAARTHFRGQYNNSGHSSTHVLAFSQMTTNILRSVPRFGHFSTIWCRWILLRRHRTRGEIHGQDTRWQRTICPWHANHFLRLRCRNRKWASLHHFLKSGSECVCVGLQHHEHLFTADHHGSGSERPV